MFHIVLLVRIPLIKAYADIKAKAEYIKSEGIMAASASILLVVEATMFAYGYQNIDPKAMTFRVPTRYLASINIVTP